MSVSLKQSVDSRANPARAAVSLTVAPLSAPFSRRPNGTAASIGSKSPSAVAAAAAAADAAAGEETARKTLFKVWAAAGPGYGGGGGRSPVTPPPPPLVLVLKPPLLRPACLGDGFEAGKKGHKIDKKRGARPSGLVVESHRSVR